MRLPTATPKQVEMEAARELHERLWRAYQRNGRVSVAVVGERRRAYSRVGELHKFWRRRSYKLHCTMQGDQLWLWLTQRERVQPRAVVGDVDLTWNQPGVR